MAAMQVVETYKNEYDIPDFKNLKCKKKSSPNGLNLSTFHFLSTYGQKCKIFGEIEGTIPISISKRKTKNTYLNHQYIRIKRDKGTYLKICEKRNIFNHVTHTSSMQ